FGTSSAYNQPKTDFRYQADYPAVAFMQRLQRCSSRFVNVLWVTGKRTVCHSPRCMKMAAAASACSGLPATTGLSLELWQSVQYEVYLSLHNPFVQGLAQGTLDRRSFQHYVAQDAYFLKYFARAYGIMLSKALALDDDTYSVLSRLLRGVHAELQLHGAYAAKWGVSLDLESELGLKPLAAAGAADGGGDVGQVAAAAAADADAPPAVVPGSGGGGCEEVLVCGGPSAATRAYTDFLMEVAESGSVADVLAAMLPCSRLYGFL
ncbi:hypothetical protein Agub_g11166, partial [Astrephomene gubernaculifera]